nr:GNAT family N-acetyltransferase [Longispora albida]
MTPADATQVLAIFQAGIDTGDASFEERAPSWAAFDAARLPAHRLVATSEDDEGTVLGWAALTAYSSRPVYAGVAELGIYVDPRAQGRGVGGALLGALVEATEAAGIWTLQAGVFPENTASLTLHERAGFRVLGVHEKLGCQRGRWRDVIRLERRSRVTGT